MPKQSTLDKVLKDFNSSWTYTQSSWHPRWLDNYSLYNNNRVKRGYQGITDTFVPMVFSTIETMTAAIFGTRPKFDYLAPTDKMDQNTEILNSLVDYYWDKDSWTIKMISCGRSMLQLGTAILYVWWNGDHPCIINVPIRDFFIDPTATRLDNASYMGRRYLTTLEELKSFEIVDMDNLDENGDPTGEMKKRFTNLGKLTTKSGSGVTGTQELTDKEEKDLYYGSTLDSNVKQIEVIEWWTEDKVVSVANRATVIEETDNWYKTKGQDNGDEFATGLFPFVAFRDYIEESLFYAKGEIDFISDQQELLNDITNQNVDAVTYTLNPMYTLDPDYADLLNEIENVPGAVYLAKQNALLPIPMRPIPHDAFNERLNLKNEIRETTASNEIVKGVAQQGGKITATEINAQVAGSGQRLSLKVSQLENESFHDLANIVFKMIQLYVTEPMLVRIVGKDGIRWESFDPSDFKGQYEPRVQLDTTIQQQKQQEAQIGQQMLAAFLNDPDINQVELKKRVLRQSFGLEPDEVDQLVQPKPVQQMPPPGANPLMAGPSAPPMAIPQGLAG